MLDTKLSQLRKANQRLHKSVDLKLDDHELLKQMFAYLEHKRLNPYDLETVRADVLGMAQEAKKRKQPLRELIGDDRAFCDGLLTNCNKSRPLAVLCDWLSLLFRLVFICYGFEFIFFNNGSIIFLGQPRIFVITIWQIFWWLFLYVAFELLNKIFPRSYRNNRYGQYLSLLMFILIIVLMPQLDFYQHTFFKQAVFHISGFTNLAVLALLGMMWPGFRYAADTLAYRQSCFDGK